MRGRDLSDPDARSWEDLKQELFTGAERDEIDVGAQRLIAEGRAFRWLLMLVLPLGYFVIGGQSALSGVQNLYEHGGVFWATVVVTAVSGVWLAWMVLKGGSNEPGAS